MWDFIIKRELNKTLTDMNKNIIDPPVAKNKLNDLVKLTKANASKGNKRDIKKDIFRIKKQFKL